MQTFHQLLRLLPTGQQGFTAIRKQGRIYVDKTSLLFQLSLLDQPLLLTRPRRFGKSTLVSTLEELFLHGVAPYNGHDSYFKGLEIENLWPQVPRNEGPFYVLHLDFSVLLRNCHSAADFANRLNDAIMQFATNAHIKLQTTANSTQDAFELLINAVPDDSLVLLVDEYDAPLTRLFTAENDAESEKMTQVMRDFFILLKASSGKLRFTFITGITRLKDTAIFSAGNSVADISQKPEYGTICGITREELMRYFPEHLRYAAAKWLQLSAEQVTDQHVEQLLDEMATWYDGYCFDRKYATHVFSLWSVLSFFSEEYTSFSPYWFAVSGQAELQKILSQQSWPERLNLLAGDCVKVGSSEFQNPSTLKTMRPEVLLFQAGYLTLKAPFGFKVSLGVPNKEIESALTQNYYEELLPNAEEGLDYFSTSLRAAIKNHDAAALQKCCNELLLSADCMKYPLTQESAIVHSLNLGISLALHVRLVLNQPEALGRPDVLFDWQDTTVVIELKYAQTRGTTQKLLQQAAQQIVDNKYGETFARRPILWRLAMVFCAETREITDVQVVS